MSRRTQLTTKFIFQITAQLSENFIFIYLGLTLFTETDLEFKPLFILITVFGICVARYLAVFPLSKVINYIIRIRARRRGRETIAEELPWHYQAMLFWAGLRGAVGVALAAGLAGTNGPALRATVLVVVVLTVIIFGGTTARMLEILGIRTGVVEEIDSDDEFDIETSNGATYYRRSGGLGHNPRPSNIGLDYVSVHNNKDLNHNHNHKPANGTANTNTTSTTANSRPRTDRGYSSSNRHSPPIRPGTGPNTTTADRRKNSNVSQCARELGEREQRTNLLGGSSSSTPSDDETDDDGIDLDLPPAAPRRKSPSPMPLPMPPSQGDRSRSAPNIVVSDSINDSGDLGQGSGVGGESSSSSHHGAMGAMRDLWRGAVGASDHGAWLKQLDEEFIKPKLLLDQRPGGGGGAGREPPV
jgi:solute carrier family 9 (sodium/hydrogen exchanger), member 6/7